MNNQHVNTKQIHWSKLLPSCGAAVGALILVGIGVLFLAFIFFMAPDATRDSETESNFESRSYTFNPVTILNAIDQGDTEVFTLQTATPEATLSPSSGSVFWRQADYFRVVQPLFQRYWNEPFEAQNFYIMSFSLDCADVQRSAFSRAEFNSFKIIQTGKEETRVEFSVSINPSDHLVRTYQGQYTPDKKKFKPIALAHYRISAEEALQIAEKNGGAETRSKYGNDCTIHIIASGGDGSGWDVSYSDQQDGFWWNVFEVAINPQTGAFKIHQ